MTNLTLAVARPVRGARPGRRRAPAARAAFALLVALVATLVLAACTEPEDVTETPLNTDLTVAGSSGAPPELLYRAPLDVPEARSEVVWPGAGAELVDGGPLLLNIYAQDVSDGTVLQNTYTDAPRWRSLTDESVGRDLRDLLRGQRVGARLLRVEEDDGVPVALVVDVLPTRASGEDVPPVEGLPTVTRAEDGTPTVQIPAETSAPAGLVVQPLIRGDGRQVEVGQVVTVRYSGVRWSDGEVFDSTWTDGAAPLSIMIGIGEVNEGWEQGLLEQSVGSQVLLVVPPDLAYGETANPLAGETLVYVVDILDAQFPVTAEEAAEGGADGAGTDTTGDAPADQGESS
ncbi:FKBP-type peptidyl-prolyl cis-trans isomerase [Cellulosimicrobium protaetiae]|uniref:peptidylprolyl isomerase n=1 Tax=Cellulosimicrobium protaetiae TaxID=2587808 RepID=A0A6M5UDJ8_9MICO|nr:FKBP-type peptidyl-prolyl cis-trans isomerase [Cellulosimicrobium protaetiae]QJW36657.1 FKBP-type peptidyl-prolyl cis-trans isomerase [Cellulosimicrobium protaetiae]